MGNFSFTRIYTKLLYFITLQLFISCVSLPLLGYWGLPQPLLSAVGNMIFAPFLTLFLLISTAAFFGYLIGFTITPLLFVLEKLTTLWKILVSYEVSYPFISCVKPPYYLCIMVPVLALYSVAHPRTRNPYIKIILLISILCSTHLFLSFFYTPPLLITPISCNGGEIIMVKNHHITTIIDPGIIGKRLSAASFCEYTLIPEVIKRTGTHTIDHFICLKPGKILFESLFILAERNMIKNLYVPAWQNHIPLSAWIAYTKLSKAIKLHKGKIHRLKTGKRSISNTHIVISSTSTQGRYHDALFPQFYIDGIIDNNCVSIYAP